MDQKYSNPIAFRTTFICHVYVITLKYNGFRNLLAIGESQTTPWNKSGQLLFTMPFRIKLLQIIQKELMPFFGQFFARWGIHLVFEQ